MSSDFFILDEGLNMRSLNTLIDTLKIALVMAILSFGVLASLIMTSPESPSYSDFER